jgi:hypothetical protein
MHGRRRAGMVGLQAIAAAFACAARGPSTMPLPRPLALDASAPGIRVQVQFDPLDEREAERVREAVLASRPALQRWGAFRLGVALRVFPDHDALEDAVERHDYPWLRAWAFGDRIFLQSPRTWGEPPSTLHDELVELLAHELTHSLMYQLIQPSAGGALDEPPLWFREGMASVTSGQGRRRLRTAELARWMGSHPGANVLNPSAEIYRTQKDAVYGAAHRAFELLLEVAGDEAVRDLMRRMRSGSRFDAAFASSIGVPLSEFEAQAVRMRFARPASSRPTRGAAGP